MKLKNANDDCAVCNYASNGPAFGSGHDLWFNGPMVYLNIGIAYESGPSGKLTTKNDGGYASLMTKEIKMLQVADKSSRTPNAPTKGKQTQDKLPKVKRSLEDVNEAINVKWESLLQFESEMLHLQDSFKDDFHFVATIASGSTKDVVTLNVSGTIMVTEHSTLYTAKYSVLAQQFNDSKWTEQGLN